MRLSFCHVLSWFANITNSKPNKPLAMNELINWPILLINQINMQTRGSTNKSPIKLSATKNKLTR